MNQQRKVNRYAGEVFEPRFAREAFQHAQSKESTPMLRQHVSELAYRKPPEISISTRTSY
jgi:hypothetical protein